MPFTLICDAFIAWPAIDEVASESPGRMAPFTAVTFTATTLVGGVIPWYALSSLRFSAEMALLLALLMITSKGSAGVAGAALVVLAATLSATEYIPVAGVALILGIHRFMGEVMAVTNLIGNGVATIVVGKWCGQVDEAQLAGRLGNAAAVKQPGRFSIRKRLRPRCDAAT